MSAGKDQLAGQGGSTEAQRKSLWHHRDFLKMWYGEAVSLLGDQFTGLAFPLTAVLILHASAAQMGVLQALGTLPFLLLGLVAGVWADRYRRRRLMIMSDVSRALLLLSIPVAFLWGGLSIYLLYLVTFGTGMFTVVFDISYQATSPLWSRGSSSPTPTASSKPPPRPPRWSGRAWREASSSSWRRHSPSCSTPSRSSGRRPR